MIMIDFIFVGELRGFENFKIDLKNKIKNNRKNCHFAITFCIGSESCIKRSILSKPCHPNADENSKQFMLKSNVAKSGEMGRPRHKTKVKTQSQNSGPPEVTASSHSTGGQSSNDDASNFSSNISTNSKSNIEEEYLSNCCKVSRCLAINGHRNVRVFKRK